MCVCVGVTTLVRIQQMLLRAVAKRCGHQKISVPTTTRRVVGVPQGYVCCHGNHLYVYRLPLQHGSCLIRYELLILGIILTLAKCCPLILTLTPQL